ncbi:MAG: ATP-binding cassette domain-containing protein [Chitinophagales bacterium]
MTITFSNVVPAFLAGTSVLKSEVWGNSFALPVGKSVLVKAQSGKGKTTFLSYLFGSRTGYSGKITFDEKDISTLNTDNWSELRREKLSMVIQDLRLFENLTVRENLKVKLDLSNQSFAEAEQMLQKLGVGDFMDRQCRSLSLGQQQRVAIVRSLCQPFKWLLLDEPFSHLDEENTAIAMQLIKKKCAVNGAGYIISSLGSEHHTHYDIILNL